MCVSLAGLDELQVHGPNSLQILLDHRFERAAPFIDIPLQTADHAQVMVGVHEYPDIHHVPQFCMSENQDPFHNDYGSGVYCYRSGCALVAGKVVDGDLY